MATLFSRPRAPSHGPRPWDHVWRKRLALGAIVWLVAVGLGVTYAIRSDRVYRVDVILAPVHQGDLVMSGMPSQLGALASLAGVGTALGDESEVAVATMTGRQFTESLVREENLLPRLFSERWDEGAKRWRGRPPTASDAYRLLERGGVRKLLRDRRTGLLTLRFEHPNRQLLVDLARLSVARTNEVLRRRATKEATASIEYLTKELNRQPLVEVRTSIHRLIESQVKRRMLAEVRSDFALATVDFAGKPDEGDFVRPRRVMIVATAALIGLILALAMGLAPTMLRESKLFAAPRAHERPLESVSP